ncbi:MAG: hypothetical protein ACKOYI_10025 [Actinomycetota bacterium]
MRHGADGTVVVEELVVGGVVVVVGAVVVVGTELVVLDDVVVIVPEALALELRTHRRDFPDRAHE